jgi:hypothetical protein
MVGAVEGAPAAPVVSGQDLQLVLRGEPPPPDPLGDLRVGTSRSSTRHPPRICDPGRPVDPGHGHRHVGESPSPALGSLTIRGRVPQPRLTDRAHVHSCWVAELTPVADEMSLSRVLPRHRRPSVQMELTCPLSTVIFIEGKPQRPHRRFVAVRSRTLVLHCFVGDSVLKQIPGRSRHWFNVSDL